MSPQQDVFNGAIELFASDQEDVRTAAAFAAGRPSLFFPFTALSHCASSPGNIAIGNLQLFLPFIVQLVKQDDSKRLLALHALKEVVTHTSTSHLEHLAETLWVPLFENSENADESSRGVAAACIGKLITTHPARYLPQVHVCTPRYITINSRSYENRPASVTRMPLLE
jgi:cullin-associated NEDD8-dissociated protein 1